MNCSKCGKKVNDDWSFCNYCGNQLQKKEDNKIDSTKKNNTCFSCGRKIESNICVCGNAYTKHISEDFFSFDFDNNTCYKMVKNRFNISYEAAELITKKFIDKIHLDWVKDYEAKNGYKNAKKYYEDIERGENLWRNNKYDDIIGEATICKIYTICQNDITKRWNNANSKKEEEQIEEESLELLDNIALDFLNELEEFKNNTEYLETYYDKKREEEKIIADENRLDSNAFWIGVVISMFAIPVYWNLLLNGNSFIGDTADFIINIILIIINSFLSYFLYSHIEKIPYWLKVIFIPMFAPIIIGLFICFALGSVTSIEAVNERNRDITERKRQEMIKDMYNKKR